MDNENQQEVKECLKQAVDEVKQVIDMDKQYKATIDLEAEFIKNRIQENENEFMDELAEKSEQRKKENQELLDILGKGDIAQLKAKVEAMKNRE